MERREERGFALTLVFGPQPAKHLVEQRQRPAPLEDTLRCLGVGWLTRVLRFGGRELQGQERPAAALLRALTIPLIGEEVLHRRQQKRPEAALRLIGSGDPVLFQQTS